MSRGRGLRTSTAVERSGVVMPPTASDPADGAMKLSTELGKGAACIRTLLAELQNDDNSTLWWLWRIAMLQPQALESPPPVLLHPSGETLANILYSVRTQHKDQQPDDARYRPGLWCPPPESVIVGVCICDVGSPVPQPIPAMILAHKADNHVTVTLCCPTAPLGSLEHELFDANLAPSQVQRYFFSTDAAPTLYMEEHKRRTESRDALVGNGLSHFDSFLFSGGYYAQRRTVFPFLNLRRAATEEEHAALRRLPGRLSFGELKQNPNALDPSPAGESEPLPTYSFEVVLQANDAPCEDSGKRFDTLLKTPILAPLVDVLLFRSLKSQAPSRSLPSEEQAFAEFVGKLRERETKHASGPLSTRSRKYQDVNLPTLDALTRVPAKPVLLGEATRLCAAVHALFENPEATFLEKAFEEAGNTTCAEDLRTIGQNLHPDDLILYTKIDSSGLIASTTCCGNKVHGLQIGLDAVSRLCTFPWVAHLVEAQGTLSRRVPGTGLATTLRLHSGPRTTEAAPMPVVTPVLNVSRMDLEALSNKIDALGARLEEVRELSDGKRKRPDGDGDGDNDGNGSTPAVAAVAAVAETSVQAVEDAAKQAIAKLQDRACAAAGAAAVTAAAGTVAAQQLPPSPTEVPEWASCMANLPVPSGIAALDQALKKMQKQDVELHKRLDALVSR